MSIKHSLLALLSDEPRYGYQLRAEFELRTGSTWPLNIGQVYTTLDRCERDGLVERHSENDDGQVLYSLTEAGRTEAGAWFATPVAQSTPPRNELAIKLALAITLPRVDVTGVVQAQRVASMKTLQDYTRQRRAATETTDTAWLLVLDSLIFTTEAELRWLDHCEGWLARRPRTVPVSTATAPLIHALDRQARS